MRRRHALALLAALALGACGGSGSPAVDYGPPDAPGPFAVGITTLEVDSGGRTLPVEVWYPAAPAAEAEVASYTLEVLGIEVATAPSPSGAVRDAPADLTDGPYPVVIFSHGNGGVRIQSFYLTEHLASHGFVVAAPDHVGNTLETEFDTSLALPGLEVAKLRPQDVSRTLDAVLAASEGAGVLAGSADPDRVGVAGHSFGGYTALRIAGATLDTAALDATCRTGTGLFCDGWTEDFEMPASQRDDRFLAALPMAPASSVLAGGFDDVAVPVMIEHGDADRTTPLETEGTPAFEALPPPAWLVVVADAGHYNFSDMCRLAEVVEGTFKQITEDAVDDGCGPDNIAWPEAEAISEAYAAAFFHTEVAGRAGYEAWLDAEPDLAGVAEIETK